MVTRSPTDEEAKDSIQKLNELCEELMDSVKSLEDQIANYVDPLTEKEAKTLADHLGEHGADDITKGIPNWMIRRALLKRIG